MLTRTLFLLTLLLGGTVLLAGAWTGSFTLAPRNSEVAFVPQTVPLDPAIIGSGIDAKQLLEKALEKMGGHRTAWVKTKIRQTMTDADSSFVAEGFLLRGPKHCARLEMDIGEQGRLLVVSDGEVVAQVRKIPGNAPDVVVERFPASSESQANDAALKEEFLGGKSCGGPTALLHQFHRRLQKGKLQTGLIQATPVIQVKGEVNPEAMAACAGATMPFRFACIYLNAKTLWPHRLEWRAHDKSDALGSVLCIEFLEPQFDQELSVEECMRVFSYKP